MQTDSRLAVSLPRLGLCPCPDSASHLGPPWLRRLPARLGQAAAAVKDRLRFKSWQVSESPGLPVAGIVVTVTGIFTNSHFHYPGQCQETQARRTMMITSQPVRPSFQIRVPAMIGAD